VKKATYDNNNQ